MRSIHMTWLYAYYANVNVLLSVVFVFTSKLNSLVGEASASVTRPNSSVEVCTTLVVFIDHTCKCL